MRLQKDNLRPFYIGIFFSIGPLTYIPLSALFSLMPTEGRNFQRLVAFGVGIYIISMLLTGPAPIIFENKLWIMAVGIALTGVGATLVNNNVVSSLN